MYKKYITIHCILNTTYNNTLAAFLSKNYYYMKLNLIKK